MEYDTMHLMYGHEDEMLLGVHAEFCHRYQVS